MRLLSRAHTWFNKILTAIETAYLWIMMIRKRNSRWQCVPIARQIVMISCILLTTTTRLMIDSNTSAVVVDAIASVRYMSSIYTIKIFVIGCIWVWLIKWVTWCVMIIRKFRRFIIIVIQRFWVWYRWMMQKLIAIWRRSTVIRANWICGRWIECITSSFWYWWRWWH